MLGRLHRDRAIMTAVLSGALLLLVYLVAAVPGPGVAPVSRAERLLTVEPWYCDVVDPEVQGLVARSVETFHDGGTLEGRTRLEDREAGTLLLEFSYQGVWQFDDPWLTEAINEYHYLHVDPARFPAERLAAIEREYGEPEISRVHALTEGQLVYGASHSLYQCHRRPQAASV